MVRYGENSSAVKDGENTLIMLANNKKLTQKQLNVHDAIQSDVKFVSYLPYHRYEQPQRIEPNKLSTCKVG